MKITNIRLQNFGPFYGKHEVKFPSDGSGVHIIRGDTGQGKTSLQRAILWALYGKVFDRNGKEIPPTSLLNRSASRDNDFAFAVGLFFNHEGKKWVLTRKTAARFHQAKQYFKGMKLFLVKNGVPQAAETSEPLKKVQLEIERILPFDVSRFFFFDGEMLVKYEELLDQDSRSMRILRNSIEHILGIPYLRTARDDLYEVKRKMEKELAKLARRLGGKDYDDLADVYQYICEEIERKKNQMELLQKQIDTLEEEIATKKRNLTDIQSVKENAMKRRDIESGIKSLEAKADSEKIKLKNLNCQLYKTVLSPIADSIIEKLKLKHEKIMDKYNKKQQLIGRLKNLEQAIDAQRCKLCGNILNPVKLREFESEREETKIKIESLTEIPEPNLAYETSAKYLEKMKSQFVRSSEYERIDEDLTEINHKIASQKASLKQIEQKLISVDEEEPFRLETQIRVDTEELGRLKGEKSALKDQLEVDLSTKSELTQKLASIDREELNILTKKINYVKEISDVFEESIAIYRGQRRKEVESKATEIFKKIRSKKDFSKLEINENFGLSIITKDGTLLNKAEWRSAGEEQIVALALIGALNKCAQIEAPVFMDTPFARLDITHGQRVLTYLPNMSDQVAVFVTDREFRKEDEVFLEGKIMSDHTLQYKSEDEGACIIKTP